MTDSVSPDHPIFKLVFFCNSEDITDTIRDDIEKFLVELAPTRRWLLGPPRFFDEWQEVAGEPHEIQSFENLGGFLELYSSFPPWRQPRGMDFHQLEDATVFLTALEGFSAAKTLDFDVEYAGEEIGDVLAGKMDEGLAETFLGEWRRALENPDLLVRDPRFNS